MSAEDWDNTPSTTNTGEAQCSRGSGRAVFGCVWQRRVETEGSGSSLGFIIVSAHVSVGPPHFGDWSGIRTNLEAKRSEHGHTASAGSTHYPKGNHCFCGGNPFGAGGGRGNLFAPQAPKQQGELSPEALVKLREIADKLGRSLLRDDAQGRAEYARRLGVWGSVHAGVRPALEASGYPLSPGTAAPGSGECYGCGKVTTPWHRKSECPGPAIPQKEATFRSICGKRGRGGFSRGIVRLEPQRTVREPGLRERPSCPSVHDNDVFLKTESEIIDLYTVGAGKREKCEPFEHWVVIHGPQGEKVRVKALFDGGATVAAMDTAVWERNRHRLGGGEPSRKVLRMASGQPVSSQAAWEGTLEMEGITATGPFEVFDSGGGWAFLFGRPLLRAFRAVHDFGQDIVSINVGGVRATLSNQRGARRWMDFKPASEVGVPTAFTGTFVRKYPHCAEKMEELLVDSEGSEEGPPPLLQGEEDVHPSENEVHTRTNSTGARATPVRE
ncbi:hypothetical protein B0H13DRAFT_1896655 [Mycena leptocephala]|nr:hypothetical protein B0H13DRAFT_1896655 [Mycena leptocephala]